MSIKLSHEFSTWHPDTGGIPTYTKGIFVFTYPVSRTRARDIVE